LASIHEIQTDFSAKIKQKWNSSLKNVGSAGWNRFFRIRRAIGFDLRYQSNLKTMKSNTFYGGEGGI